MGSQEMSVVRDRDPQALLEQIEARSNGDPLRIRLAPSVNNPETKSYIGLPGVSWLLDVRTAEGVRHLREGLDLFFDLTERLGGPTAMKEYMEQCKASIEGHEA